MHINIYLCINSRLFVSCVYVAAVTVTTTTITESQLRTGGEAIVVTLTNDQWATLDATNTEALYDAFGTTAGSAWVALKAAVTFPTGFALSQTTTADDTLTFTLPADADALMTGGNESLATLTVPAANVVGSASDVSDVSAGTVTLEDEGGLTVCMWQVCVAYVRCCCQ
jgi:hypothetical protein